MGLFGGLKKQKLLQRLSDQKWKNDKDFHALLDGLRKSELSVGDILFTLSVGTSAVRNFGAEIVLANASAQTARQVYDEARSKNHHAQRFIRELFMKLPLEFVVPVLQAQIGDSDETQKEIAVELLGRIPLEDVWNVYVGLLDSGDVTAQKQVLDQLAREPQFLARPGVKPKLMPLLESPDEDLRATFVDILVRFEGKAQFETVFKRFLHDESDQIRSNMVGHLCDWVRDPALAEEIQKRVLPLLEEGEASTRQRAAQIIVSSKEVYPVLRRLLVSIKDLAGWIRERAMETLQEFEHELIPPTMRLLEDEDEDIRVAAMMMAAYFDDPRLLNPVLALMKDPDWWLRITAARILGQIGDARAVPALIAALDDEDVKWTAIGSLAQIGDPKGLRPIAQLLSDKAPEIRLEVLNALEQFGDIRVLPLVEKCAKLDPALEVRERAAAVHNHIAKVHEKADEVTDLGDVASLVDEGKLDELSKLLVKAREQEASDIHIKVDSPPMFRIHGELVAAGDEPLDATGAAQLVIASLSERQRKIFSKDLQLDYCYTVPNVGRYRANAYKDRLGVGAVFRVVPNRIPTFEQLRLPDQLKRLADFHQGFIVLAGPASSGKTTTLAALIDLLNNAKPDHILTLEDPIEFVHTFKKCLVNQREVGKHTKSFAAALRGALRQDPDVIVVGEMRDTETLSLAMTAAETGHLVIGTMHTTSAHKTVDRLIESFPPGEQPAVRTAMSETLKAVVCQSLLPRADGKGRVAAFEMLFSTGPLSNIIRDGKTIMIPSVMQTGRAHGMQTLDDALRDLLEEELITPETAYHRCVKKEDFEPLLPDDVREALHAMEL